MLLTLMVFSAALVTVGYVVGRKRALRLAAANVPPARLPEHTSSPAKTAPPSKVESADPFADLPLALGDVVITGTEERWLAGAVVAREEGNVVGALFIAPEGAEDKAVAVFAPPRKDIVWMAQAEVTSPPEPPAVIELGGIPLTRKGRLPVSLERLGQGAPPVGEDGLWAVYERGRDVGIVILSQRTAYAWIGTRLDEDEYDRLGSAS